MKATAKESAVGYKTAEEIILILAGNVTNSEDEFVRLCRYVIDTAEHDGEIYRHDLVRDTLKSEKTCLFSTSTDAVFAKAMRALDEHEMRHSH